MGFLDSISNFFSGTPEKRENVSTLRPEQEGIYKQLVRAGKRRGAGGAFGRSADYYRDLLSNDSADYDAFSAPALRQYNEEIVPGLSEQFAGMGAGGLSSSGFRNAQVQGATDLAERLGAIRANLRQSGAQGLQNIGQMGLNPYSQNMVTEPGKEGFLSKLIPSIGGMATSFLGDKFGGSSGSGQGGGLFSQIAPLLGTVAGSALGGPAGGAIGSGFGNWLGGKVSGGGGGGASSPYGSGGPKSSPSSGGGFGLPNFLQGTRYGG